MEMRGAAGEESEDTMDVEWSDPTPQEPLPCTKSDSKGKQRDILSIVKALCAHKNSGTGEKRDRKDLSFLRYFLQRRAHPPAPVADESPQIPKDAAEAHQQRRSARRRPGKVSDSQWDVIRDMITSLRDGNTDSTSAAADGSQGGSGVSQDSSSESRGGDEDVGREGGRDLENSEEDGFDDLPENIVELLTQLEASQHLKAQLEESGDSNPGFPDAHAVLESRSAACPSLRLPSSSLQLRKSADAAPSAGALPSSTTRKSASAGGVVGGEARAFAGVGAGSRERAASSAPTQGLSASTTLMSTSTSAAKHAYSSSFSVRAAPRAPTSTGSSGAPKRSTPPLDVTNLGAAALPEAKRSCTSEEIEKKRLQALILKKKKDAERRREVSRQRQVTQQQEEKVM